MWPTRRCSAPSTWALAWCLLYRHQMQTSSPAAILISESLGISGRGRVCTYLALTHELDSVSLCSRCLLPYDLQPWTPFQLLLNSRDTCSSLKNNASPDLYRCNTTSMSRRTCSSLPAKHCSRITPAGSYLQAQHNAQFCYMFNLHGHPCANPVLSWSIDRLSFSLPPFPWA